MARRQLTFSQQIEQSLLTEYRKAIWRPFMHAIRDYRLILPGDRIAVCISGGKDSMLLAKLIQILSRHTEVPFEAVYLVMDPGYNPANRRQIEENARRLEIPCTVFESDVFEVAEAQDEHPCFLCARMRRGCLYGKAQELGCNKIALGHHFNDVIETTVMAMLYGGQLQAMPPKLRARNFPGMELIRPLYRVHEQAIIDWMDAFGLEFIQCACRLTETAAKDESASRRRFVKSLLAQLNDEHPKVEQNVFNSIHRVQLNTMVGWKYRGEEHSFLDQYDDPPEA
ncbi:MAG: ATP-binding protein [Clostridia bacterium]|nr:ATP-binding protein [Clostridia bacterium]